MFNSHDVDHMISMFCKLLDGLFCFRGMDEWSEGVQAYHTVQIPNRTKLLIGQITRNITECTAVGVRGNDRSCCNIHNIPETIFIQMRGIYKHAKLLHSLYNVFSGFCQTICKTGSSTCTQQIFLIPGQHAMAASKIVIFVNLRYIIANGSHTFDADPDVKFTSISCLFHLSDGMYDLYLITFSGFVKNGLFDLCGSDGIVLNVRSLNPDDEDAAFHLTGTKPVQMVIL